MKRKNLFLFVLVIVFVAACKQERPVNIPVTTSSEDALALLKEGQAAFYSFDFLKGSELCLKAIELDNDFFMPKAYLGFYYKYFEDEEELLALIEQLAASDMRLSDGEEQILKMVLSLENEEDNGKSYAETLVELYPRDFNAYVFYNWIHGIDNDWEPLLEINKKVIDSVMQHGMFYNTLGYAYMYAGNMGEAEKAFDAYIKMEGSTNPNPWDSKGDYFMQMLDYPAAYSSYMKANELNEDWGIEKAMRAKAIMDSLALEMQNGQVN